MLQDETIREVIFIDCKLICGIIYELSNVKDMYLQDHFDWSLFRDHTILILIIIIIALNNNKVFSMQIVTKLLSVRVLDKYLPGINI